MNGKEDTGDNMIQIDMKMPKDCEGCPFNVYLEPGDSRCHITHLNVWFAPKGERDFECPMQEVKEVKADDVCPEPLELIDPKIPENCTEKAPEIRVNYLKKEFGALCDTCAHTDNCKWYGTFSAYGLRYIETCKDYEEHGEEKAK